MWKSLQLAAILWVAYQVWQDQGYPEVDPEVANARPRPSRSRLRRMKREDYGAQMSLLQRYKHASTELAQQDD